jgi:SAM-dependent methyltransferase
VRTIPCPLCGGDRATPAFRAREFVLHRREYQLTDCEDCGHRFVNPAPEPTELEDYYARAVPALRATYGETGTPADSPVEQEKIDLLRSLQLGDRPGTLCDVGFGGGGFLLAMDRLGWRASGVEFTDKVELPFDASRFEIVLGADALQQLPAGKFDLVTLWHVLEHFADPVEKLRSLRRALRPDGRLVIAVPNAGGLTARLFGPRWFATSPPWHLQQFTPRSLSRTLCEAGFSVDHVSGFGDLPMRICWVDSITEVMDTLPTGWSRLPTYQLLRAVRKATSLTLPVLVRLEQALGLPGAMVAVARRNPLLDRAPLEA